MCVAARGVRPELTPPVELDPACEAGPIHACRQRGALRGGLVCQPRVGELELVHAVQVRVVVEVVWRPFDGEGVVLAARVRLLVKSYGRV